MRELLAEENVAQPDAVEYGYGCVRLYWTAPKVVVVVDVDDYGEIGESRLGAADDIEPALQREAEDVPIPPIPLPTDYANGDHGGHDPADEQEPTAEQEERTADEPEPRDEAA